MNLLTISPEKHNSQQIISCENWRDSNEGCNIQYIVTLKYMIEGVYDAS